ncbi:peptidoglycan/LPS O-acetylase OafA/YrhL [Paraburkholderia caballeronis]|uniref:acyltransferase family protein n=1 Tax=Paraburkholderia caballeronis TaxID=416943 RepID=UPI001064F3D3|nr:acyltransferase [Paraburkholderia caballeronis]TDV35567.1 peptidoglycan/LPS O-acetylase OafA/YrhL [Paraburkholderia caballeronis]
MTKTTERFATLDGIRAVAAVLVVTLHAPKLFSWLPALTNVYLAVDLFFCLSGFVIARTYRDRLVSGALTPGRFIAGRAIRFYPLYALGLLLGLVPTLTALLTHGMSSVAMGAGLVTALAGFLYLPSPLHPRVFPLDSPAWSLASELVVNAVYAALACRRSRMGLALLFVLAAVEVGLYAHHAGNLDGGWEWPSITVGPARAALSFSIGIFLERHTRGSHFRSNALALLPVLVVPALLLSKPSFVPPSIYPLAVVGIAVPALIFAAAHVEPHGVLRTAFLAGGRLSYGVYIIHSPLALLWNFLPAPARHTAAAAFAFVAGVAILVWLLERYYVPYARNALNALYAALATRRSRTPTTQSAAGN